MTENMPRRISEKEIFNKGRIIIKDIGIELTDGSTVTYQYWDKPDTAMVVPLLDYGNVVLIREYQAAFDRVMLGLPKGRVDEGDLDQETAQKELEEEIGYRASRIEKVARLTTITGYIRSYTHIYLARELQPASRTGDERWEIETSQHPLARFEELIDDGQLSEARMIAALYEARRYLAAME